MSKHAILARIFVLALAFAIPPLAQAEARGSVLGLWDQRMQCQGTEFGHEYQTFEIRMDNCNAAIESGKEEGEALASLFFNRGNLYLISGKRDAALEDYGRAINIIPTYAPALLKRAWMYLQTAHYREAIADYDAVLAKDRSATLLFGRGVAETLTGETERGNRDFAAARAIDAKIEQKFGAVPRFNSAQ